MSAEAFISDLAHLLARLDRGMLEFEEPPPQLVGDGLVTALVAFGPQAVAILHTVLTEVQAESGCLHLIDALGQIGDPTSAPILIQFHQNFSSFISALAAIQALRTLKTEVAYCYLGDVLTRYAEGDEHAIETCAELVVACQALAEWGDTRAIGPLEHALTIDDPVHDIQGAARQALATYRKD
jgi:HEAT repeat protein